MWRDARSEGASCFQRDSGPVAGDLILQKALEFENEVVLQAHIVLEDERCRLTPAGRNSQRFEVFCGLADVRLDIAHSLECSLRVRFRKQQAEITRHQALCAGFLIGLWPVCSSDLLEVDSQLSQSAGDPCPTRDVLGAIDHVHIHILLHPLPRRLHGHERPRPRGHRCSQLPALAEVRGPHRLHGHVLRGWHERTRLSRGAFLRLLPRVVATGCGAAFAF